MNSLKIYFKTNPILLLMLLTCIAFPLVYSKLFTSSFISWDDGEVILNNKAVHDFNLKEFFTNYYVGNYAPITMIGFALDWQLFNSNPIGHHTTNLILHAINSFLIFHLITLIFNNKLKAFVCTIIFCFHPLQIETVAWVSAKNNLICSMFFLLGLINYYHWLLSKFRKHYFYTLMFFLLAVLSKPSAICFPFVLIILDYVFFKEFNLKKNIAYKIPFFCLSLIFGIITIFTRTQDKFINENHAYNLHERIGYAGYAIFQYFNKSLFPVNLSAINPYPEHKMPSIIAGFISIFLLVFLIYKFIKVKNNVLVFGLLFFIINILLVLQFVPFGEVLTADRYMYLPLVGIAIVFVSLLKYKQTKFIILSFCLLIVLGISSFNRSRVWKNSITLYADIINKYPRSYVALNSLGAEYMLNKNYVLAERYLNSAISENENYYKGYYNRGLLYAQTNNYDSALRDFTKAIKLNNYVKAYVARANLFYLLKDFSKAKADAEFVLKTEPKNPKVNYVLATCYDDLNQLNTALTYYNIAISSNIEEPLYYMRRGILQGKLQHFNECLVDLNIATTLNTKFAEAYYWKGVVKINLKQNPCEDLKTALNLGFAAAKQPLYKYCN